MSLFSERLVSAYGFFLLKRLSIRVAGAVVMTGISLFAVVTVVENRLASTAASLPLQVGALEQSFGYGGLIHSFKNYLLRPDEPQYAQNALRAANLALQLFDELEGEISAFPIEVELTHARAAVLAYKTRIRQVSDMHASGATAREIDAAVRFDDSLALREVAVFRSRVEAAVARRLEHLQWLTVATFLLSLGGGGVVLLVVLNEHWKAKAAFQETEQALSRERAGNEEMRDFSYAVSHDLKAPVNTVHLLLSELKEDMANRQWSDDQDELIRQSLETIERAQMQIESVIGYAGVVDGEAGPGIEVPLTELVHSVASDLRASFEKAGGGLHTEELPVVRGDPAQFRLLFQNLIENALKYRRPDVPPTVSIFLGSSPSSDDLKIHVSDNGIGIEAQHQDRIFGMFKRLHRQDQIPGIGLGLSVCLRVVRNLGGDLSVDSTPGEGSTFTVTLPKERIVTWPVLKAA